MVPIAESIYFPVASAISYWAASKKGVMCNADKSFRMFVRPSFPFSKWGHWEVLRGYKGSLVPLCSKGDRIRWGRDSALIRFDSFVIGRNMAVILIRRKGADRGGRG